MAAAGMAVVRRGGRDERGTREKEKKREAWCGSDGNAGFTGSRQGNESVELITAR